MMGTKPTKADKTVKTVNMSEPLSVYVPFESLTESVVRSIIRVVTPSYSPNWDYSQRTLLMFLLAINEKVEGIEKSKDTTEPKPDEHLIQKATEVRKWLVDEKKKPLKWDQLRQIYNKTAKNNCDDLARYHRSKNADPYFELTMPTVSYPYFCYIYSKFLFFNISNRE
jgi:hypothetical protein